MLQVVDVVAALELFSQTKSKPIGTLTSPSATHSVGLPRIKHRLGSSAPNGTTTTFACTTFLGVNGLTLLFLQDRILGDLHKIDQRQDAPESKRMCREIIHMNGAISLGQAFLLYNLGLGETISSSNSKLVGLSLLPRLAISLWHGWNLWSAGLILMNTCPFIENSKLALKGTSAMLLFQAVYILLAGQNAAKWLFQVDQ